MINALIQLVKSVICTKWNTMDELHTFALLEGRKYTFLYSNNHMHVGLLPAPYPDRPIIFQRKNVDVNSLHDMIAWIHMHVWSRQINSSDHSCNGKTHQTINLQEISRTTTKSCDNCKYGHMRSASHLWKLLYVGMPPDQIDPSIAARAVMHTTLRLLFEDTSQIRPPCR
jgi:hypothetical protein